jgi:hypothetical protein
MSAGRIEPPRSYTTRVAHARSRANRKFNSLAADGRAFFGDGTLHQQDAKRHRERHDGEEPKTIEICQRRCLLVAQVLQRLPRQLLRSSRTSGLPEETRLSLLKESSKDCTAGLSGSRDSRVGSKAEVAFRNPSLSRIPACLRSDEILFCRKTFSHLAGGCRIFDDFSHCVGVRDHHDM